VVLISASTITLCAVSVPLFVKNIFIYAFSIGGENDIISESYPPASNLKSGPSGFEKNRFATNIEPIEITTIIIIGNMILLFFL